MSITDRRLERDIEQNRSRVENKPKTYIELKGKRKRYNLLIPDAVKYNYEIIKRKNWKRSVKSKISLILC